MTPFEKVTEYLKSIGIKVFAYENLQKLVDSTSRIPDFSHSPFTGGIGISLSRMEIHHTKGLEDFAALIHEAGHLIADSKPPECSDEDFFGWEIAVAKMLEISMDEFYRMNREYGISWDGAGDGEFYSEIGDIKYPSETWLKLCAWMLQRAEAKGQIVNGVPIIETVRTAYQHRAS
jgi:hypothetical protein